MIAETTPDKWLVLEIPNIGYKVFATWAGGYTDSDKWRLNSGIKSVTKEGNDYLIEGYSKSIYRCNKNSYGVMTSWGRNVLESILNKTIDNHGVIIKELTFDEFDKLKFDE